MLPELGNRKYANQFRSWVPASLLTEQREKEKDSDRGMCPSSELLKLPSRCQEFRQPDNQFLLPILEEERNTATRKTTEEFKQVKRGGIFQFQM